MSLWVENPKISRSKLLLRFSSSDLKIISLGVPWSTNGLPECSAVSLAFNRWMPWVRILPIMADLSGRLWQLPGLGMMEIPWPGAPNGKPSLTTKIHHRCSALGQPGCHPSSALESKALDFSSLLRNSLLQYSWPSRFEPGDTNPPWHLRLGGPALLSGT